MSDMSLWPQSVSSSALVSTIDMKLRGETRKRFRICPTISSDMFFFYQAWISHRYESLFCLESAQERLDLHQLTSLAPLLNFPQIFAPVHQIGLWLASTLGFHVLSESHCSQWRSCPWDAKGEVRVITSASSCWSSKIYTWWVWGRQRAVTILHIVFSLGELVVMFKLKKGMSTRMTWLD